jgi:hypothetical protein
VKVAADIHPLNDFEPDYFFWLKSSKDNIFFTEFELGSLNNPNFNILPGNYSLLTCQIIFYKGNLVFSYVVEATGAGLRSLLLK